MIIMVNGEKKEFQNERITVEELLRLCDIENVQMVAVQLNGEFVERDRYGKVELKDNDMIDFLYFMGGGGI